MKTCDRCMESRPDSEINIEAIIHHGAGGYHCFDVKRCKRDKKKNKRKSN